MSALLSHTQRRRPHPQTRNVSNKGLVCFAKPEGPLVVKFLSSYWLTWPTNQQRALRFIGLANQTGPSFTMVTQFRAMQQPASQLTFHFSHRAPPAARSHACTFSTNPRRGKVTEFSTGKSAARGTHCDHTLLSSRARRPRTFPSRNVEQLA